MWRRGLIHKWHLFSYLSSALVFVFRCSWAPTPILLKQALFAFITTFFFTFLSCVLVVTHCRAGELWKTPDWSAKKTTSMSASCACVLSWTTRSVLCSPRRTSIQTACPSGLKHTHLTEAKFNFFHCVFSMFNLSCRGMHLLSYFVFVSLPPVAIFFSPCSTASTWSCHTHMLWMKLH